MIKLGSLSPDQIAQLPVKQQWALAYYWRDCGEFEWAEWLVAWIAEQCGESPKVLEEQCRLALAKGDTAAAMRYAQRQSLTAPSASAEIAVGRVWLAAGNCDLAQETAESVLGSRPDMMRVQVFAADVAMAAGDFDTANERCIQMIKINGQWPLGLLGRTRVALAQGDEKSALQLLAHLTTEPEKMNIAQLREAADHFEKLGQADSAAALWARAEATIHKSGERL